MINILSLHSISYLLALHFYIISVLIIITLRCFSDYEYNHMYVCAEQNQLMP